MGCNIHLLIEKKNKNGCWENVTLYEKLNDTSFEVVELWERDYIFYSLIANVRNYDDLKFISKPRGLPNDISELNLNLLTNIDYHSHSYNTLLELTNFARDIQDNPFLSNSFNKWFQTILDYIKIKEIYISDYNLLNYRIVYAFDN